MEPWSIRLAMVPPTHLNRGPLLENARLPQRRRALVEEPLPKKKETLLRSRQKVLNLERALGAFLSNSTMSPIVHYDTVCPSLDEF